MSQYHEPPEEMGPQTRDIARAMISLKEEIEAADWYRQRLSVAEDPELAGILKHNMEEEMEHASMILEWLRRNMDGWDEPIKTYLNTTRPILEIEEQAEEGGEADGGSDLGIGKPSE